jgi:formylglycine-generating enzyme required for sulfatase activity
MPQSRWGIYLVDVFDNFLLIKDLPGYALLEPIPLRKTPVPPIIPEKVDLAQTEAVVYIPDIHVGDGLKGVPRGTVKSLRLVTYHFAYQGMGGLVGVVGVDGPWDIKRVLGTVPVNPDGSAKFRVPANTPISIQPLDDEGKAIQLMRTWMTAMPGEVVQCSGCHEPQNSAPPRRDSMAAGRPPARIQPWRGPLRGFSYRREVQPVIDKYCVGCHNEPRPSNPLAAFDLRGTKKITDWQKWAAPSTAGNFSVGYAELHRFVRRPGIESDYHLLEPMEFHADTTQLVQMLKKGHYNVKLDAEAWDRLITWIDLNCPFHGTWGEEIDRPGIQRQRRRDLLKLYANVDDDPEAVLKPAPPVRPLMPESMPPAGPKSLACPGWPFDAAEARRRQAAWAGKKRGQSPFVRSTLRAVPAKGDCPLFLSSDHGTRKKIDLGQGVSLEMVLIPPGEFVMGSAAGAVDEEPLARVRIERPFWMATKEVTNRMYSLFDPSHQSGVEDRNGYQFGLRGFPMNGPEQPVVRVSWNEAVAFCRWLSEKTGMKFALPSEAEWEYACRAGTATPFSYGDLDTDFSKFANLADAKLSEFASFPYDTSHEPMKNPSKYDDWLPKDARFNDGALLTVEPGRYLPNAWGLLDMHGNAAEWTRSTYRPYPYREEPAPEPAAAGRKVVRGGSWRDLPKHCTSSSRFSYLPFQRVYNVGIRVIAASDAIPAVNKVAGQ